MRIALGQINTTVGDLARNVDLMLRVAREAAGHGAEVVVFPELSVTGYPPRDLVEKSSFREHSEQQLQRLAAESSQLPLTLGGSKVALTICEDAWNDKQFWERPLYRRDPVEELAHSGAGILISINASPYHMGKRALRHEIFEAT